MAWDKSWHEYNATLEVRTRNGESERHIMVTKIDFQKYGLLTAAFQISPTAFQISLEDVHVFNYTSARTLPTRFIHSSKQFSKHLQVTFLLLQWADPSLVFSLRETIAGVSKIGIIDLVSPSMIHLVAWWLTRLAVLFTM